VLVSLSPGLALAGSPAGYAQATGYFKKDSRPTLYQPLNLLDGKDATVWCSTGPDPLNELLTFGFNGAVKIDEVRITTGNNLDEKTFAQFARARKLTLRAGKKSQTLTLEDQRGTQAVSINPPLEASRFAIEILDQYPSDDSDAPVCITDVVFVSEGKALNGPWLAAKLKYDKATALLLGTWYLGYEGTPDKFLSFNYDGTFRYAYEPFDGNRDKPVSLEGKYDASGGRITFEIAGHRHAAKVLHDESKKGGFTLSFDGDVPPELKQVFRSVP
jgi:hypothetical protein